MDPEKLIGIAERMELQAARLLKQAEQLRQFATSEREVKPQVPARFFRLFVLDRPERGRLH